MSNTETFTFRDPGYIPDFPCPVPFPGNCTVTVNWDSMQLVDIQPVSLKTFYAAIYPFDAPAAPDAPQPSNNAPTAPSSEQSQAPTPTQEAPQPAQEPTDEPTPTPTPEAPVEAPVTPEQEDAPSTDVPATDAPETTEAPTTNE